MTQLNSSFSLKAPNLQLAWDSTSMGALKTCARLYQYSIMLGYQSRNLSVHLIFGLHYHAALERYDHAKAQGESHEQATIKAVRYALEITWSNGKPWDSDDPNKNRFTLVRSVAWYLDQFENDPIETVILPDGKPAVELSFRFESGYTASTGEPFLICGHLDRVGVLAGKTYIIDKKTSKSTINQGFFEKFSPDNQFSTYTLAAKVAYKLPIEGIVVDAAQVAVTFTRFQRGMVARSEGQLEEWYKDFGYWLSLAELYAKDGYWPQNDKSCQMYGGCQFRDICSKSPNSRKDWLDRTFTKRVWDPLQTRGDI